MGILSLALLLVGCDLDDIPEAFQLDEDDFFDDDFDDFDGCAEIDGRYEATRFSFTGTEDTSLFEPFTGSALTLDFDAPRFTSTFTGAGLAPVNTTGNLDLIDDDTIVLGTNPWLPGVQSPSTRFVCRVQGDVLVLETDEVGYDYGDPGFYEPSSFSGQFVRVD